MRDRDDFRKCGILHRNQGPVQQCSNGAVPLFQEPHIKAVGAKARSSIPSPPAQLVVLGSPRLPAVEGEQEAHPGLCGKEIKGSFYMAERMYQFDHGFSLCSCQCMISRHLPIRVLKSQANSQPAEQ